MTIEYMCCNDAIIRLAVVGSFPIYGCRFIILRKKKICNSMDLGKTLDN